MLFRSEHEWQDHAPERRETPRAEVSGGLQERGGDPFKAGIDRQDHVGQPEVAEDNPVPDVEVARSAPFTELIARILGETAGAAGRKVLLPPKDIDDPLFAAHRRAYQEQRRMIEDIAARFAKNAFSLKSVFKDMVVTDFYRADGLSTSLSDPKRKAELDDVGLVRMLAPEQVERKVGAIFGERWGKLHDQLEMLYGGIDTKEVTERAADPSGAMGAIQRLLSNDVACQHVGRDFGRPAAQRLLFPGIEPSVVPGESTEGDAAIRKAIVYLHQRILGRNDKPDSAEVERTWKLFANIIKDARENSKKLDKQESY